MSDHAAFVEGQKTLALANIETSTRCTLRCPQCTRISLLAPKDSKRYIEIKTRISEGDDLSLDNAEKLLRFFNSGLMLCGSLSDPIFWPHLFDFLELSNNYPETPIQIHTAASQSDLNWYKCAFSLSGKNVTWIFGLDGMQDTSSVYRVGQNSKLVFDAMVLGKTLGVNVMWRFIVFEHNVHQLNEARDFANMHGIDLAFVKTNRTGGGMSVPVEWTPARNKEFIK